MENHNDRVIIAYYNLSGEPLHYMFSFLDLPRGGDARWARVQEYDRQVEALKGQGCDVHVWDLFHWQNYRGSFYAGNQRRML